MYSSVVLSHNDLELSYRSNNTTNAKVSMYLVVVSSTGSNVHVNTVKIYSGLCIDGSKMLRIC